MTNQKIYSMLEVITALGEKLRATGEELVRLGQAWLRAGFSKRIRDTTGSCYHSVLNVIKADT